MDGCNNVRLLAFILVFFIAVESEWNGKMPDGRRNRKQEWSMDEGRKELN
jgi:hypothetical protein